ncbi:hypothetical protein ARMGADRAFT_1083355 [Armillaria gallica]|uniref:Uncharacterized protein n=1 Tax=Armillaria gallica TaxID=47427 RepID=A0A2H3DNP5_ARMGA|nr:hypothetical protein ARMGADRAFT_1083355 [Armillaria gallica]
MLKVGGAMDHPTQPVPAQTINLTSVQSALVHLHEITDAGDGQQAKAFMWAIINNMWTSIGSAPNPILSACYPTKLVGQHLLCWIKEFLAYNWVYEACRSHMRHTDIVIYDDEPPGSVCSEFAYFTC